MPYQTDADVPTYVPSGKRSQWREVWNSAYNKAKSKGSGDKEAEQSAFRQANGVAMSELLTDTIPPGSDKFPPEMVGYEELAGAQKDALCKVVDVPGGISSYHGCCCLWCEVEGESPANFQCGTCRYHQGNTRDNGHLSAGERLVRRIFAADILQAGEVLDPVKGIYRIPLAYTGKFVKNGEEFSITATDLHEIVRNFRKKGTGTVNVDYEHASEIPELAKGGPVPASGWIQDMEVRMENDGKPWLFGTVEWTPVAKQLIETKQYRFFSPAIDWGATDKHTGDPQGATLTSSALTNRPFLEGLPPLLMTDAKQIEEIPMAENKTITLTDGQKFRLRKVADSNGTRLQVHLAGEGTGEASFGALLGEIFPKDFESLAEASSKGAPSSSKGETTSKGEPPFEKKMGEVMGDGSPVSMSDAKRFITAGREAIRMQDATQGQKLLSDTMTDKGCDKRTARKLLSEGKVSPQQYAAFENAVELVEEGVQAGKIHPSQRGYYLSDAINRPDEFAKMLSSARPFVDMSEHGLAGSSPTGQVTASESNRFDSDVRATMKEKGVRYSEAVKILNKKDPQRGQRMRDESSRNQRTM